MCFIVPGLVAILALSVLFFASHPPLWVLGAAAGAGGAVPAVAVHAAVRADAGELATSRRRACRPGAGGWPTPWPAVWPPPPSGPWLVLVLVVCGVVEIAARPPGVPDAPGGAIWWRP